MERKHSSSQSPYGKIATWAVLTLVLSAVAIEACKKSQKRVVASLPDVSTIKVDEDFCKKNVAQCERLCAACGDKAKCFAAGGECGGNPPLLAANIQDQIDRGPDIWMAGCHVDFPQPNCVGKAAPWVGDWCVDAVHIEEWFDRVCHTLKGDHYTDDCNKKCQLLGLGAGKCVTTKVFARQT